MNALSFQRSVTTTLLALSITVLATLFPSRVTSQLIGIKSVPVRPPPRSLLQPGEGRATRGDADCGISDLLFDLRPQWRRAYNSGHLPRGTDSWFGGGSFALQQLIAADRWNWWGPNTGQPLRDRSARNLYFHGFLGRMLGETKPLLGRTGCP